MKAIAVLGLALFTASGAQAESLVAKASREANNLETLVALYPKRAMAAGEQGLVGFKIKLDKDGHPTACEVTHSSGFPRLDNETCGLVLLHAVFKAETDIDGRKLNVEREGVLNWEIPGAEAPAVPAAMIPVTPASAPDKMICKRAKTTGSLASSERTCMTKREWQLMTDQMKAPWEDLKSRSATFGGG